MRTFYHLVNAYKAGDVKRYHTAIQLTNQSVAQHSWGVLALVLYLEKNPSKNLIKAATFHDLAEAVTGDIPATFKWDNPEFATTLAAHEQRIERDMGVDYELTEREFAILKVADLGELVMHNVKEIMLGNRYASVIVDRGITALERYYGDLGPTVNNFIDDLNAYVVAMKDNV